MLKNKCNNHFNYICLIDHDLEIYRWDINKFKNNVIELHNMTEYKSALDEFHLNFLLEYQPYIGLPHRIDKAGFMTFPAYPNEKCIGSKFLLQELFDAMIAYYIRPLLNNRFLFPLYSKYDYKCWWWSMNIQRFKMKMLFPYKKHFNVSLSYLPVAMKNPGHAVYPKDCGHGQDHFVKNFKYLVEKYYHNNTNHNNNTECALYYDQKQFSKWDFSARREYMKSIPKQKDYPLLKNHPDHYLDDFVCNDF